ncbi:Protein-disulfide reductase [Mycoavidus cysteinexigens]|uniref:Protein-disulfide reductase n=1 Tax=Mycoavidus cysteinexigens TaxID=1553431 RepID=A0A2Z6ESP8_9BURK|nr:protein-disulfide reductase DsbD [Mycoavidus cysteinexigens]BBE08422.1 Protein-disulfide reductase [Mycoavidus cysteinexigens]GLR00928.1 thiol:disulfide interchange protein DsbD [Mycoavidus cysteinexigens]
MLSDSIQRSQFIGKSILLMWALFYSALALANGPFLDAKAAFKMRALERPGGIEVHFSIAHGYAMYREHFGFSVGRGVATLGEPVLPPGQIKFDTALQKNFETYRNEVDIYLPVTHVEGPFELTVRTQGCADQGLCYPPMMHFISIKGAGLQKLKAETRPEGVNTGPPTLGERLGMRYLTDSLAHLYSFQYAEAVLEGHDFITTLMIFFVLGVALSLFPCSLPMIPILSALIVGEGTQLTRWRSLMLSVIYVLGMALVYTVFGMVAASAGYSLGPDLQNPWVRGVFALLLFAFALSLFGCYELQLPQSWQNRINSVLLGRQLKGGKWLAVFTMGALSALIIGACMTAPLFGVLTFIAHTGNLILGGSALFLMALGMGAPLLLVGIGAGNILPRAGVWMNGIKRVFGLLLAAVALWLVFPLLAAALNWQNVGMTWRATRMPTATESAAVAPKQLQPGSAGFTLIQSKSELQHQIRANGRPSMLEFYADWCANCREMEKITFTDSRVQAQLKHFNLLRADVTKNNLEHRALLKQFSLYGPPALLFFDENGHEISALRMIGYQSPSLFLKKIESIYTAP